MSTALDMQALARQIAQQTGSERRGKTVVRFEWHAVEDHAFFKETGMKRFTDEVYIKAYTPGAKSQTHRKATDVDKQRFPMEWLQFQATEGDDKQDGFPIMQWYGCTNGQATTLFKNGIKTVEKLAEIEDQQIARFGQAYPGLKAAAISHIEMVENTADANKLRATIDEKTSMISSLKRKVKALEKKLEEMGDENST